ncbi:DNase I-like protein [Tuber magnatum]|uniref:phosphoinositide 5-phosphatase n=1 Tax=Tuber magnatum TaxID=42249 RepID=A0A317SSS0_9PEZI|nr:DNase I-like protein [Tuber magnatum]
MPIGLRIKDHPHRSIALVTPSHALILRNSPSSSAAQISSDTSFSSILDRTNDPSSSTFVPKCIIEFTDLASVDLDGYRPLSSQPCLGTLGLITLNRDVFLSVVTSAREVASVRPGEGVSRIHAVNFHCLNRADFDDVLDSDINSYSADPDGWDQGRSQPPAGAEHPCSSLRKLLSGGTFYYSRDFDLTNRLQDRSIETADFDIDNFDPSFLWNSYMIHPLLRFRSHLSDQERRELDASHILTCTIRGFVESLTIPRSLTPAELRSAGLATTLTLISRLSCRRAGTRFNSRGIDDDGHVANFVETETVIWDPCHNPQNASLGFSYCQVRGSIPIFWEQQTGLLPNQQKIQITRSSEATQPAFDKHFESISLKYGAIHLVNLLSQTKSGEAELSSHLKYHIKHSPLTTLGSDEKRNALGDSSLLKATEYDFHAETKGPSGYEAASMISRIVKHSADAFGFFLMESSSCESNHRTRRRGQKETEFVMLQQEGVFRTNCLDCLDRTNLVQGILSKMAIESFLEQADKSFGHEFWIRHSTLWADNGDALSKIYAGTGALKSSFTRTGRMSLAGAIADARKSAARIYINNFADKEKQNTIDVLLGRLVGQHSVYLYDPINDFVTTELSKRAPEYSHKKDIHIYVGTYNLNGQTSGINDDLSQWLCPPFLKNSQLHPELVVVGFQEIVQLSPQQIMSTDPSRRQLWEQAVLKALNSHSRATGGEEYVLLRGGQLVGAALLIYVKATAIGEVRNVEGSLKKTGMSGVAGNKGAVAIRMEYANTRLCFVTAHLAAGFSNYEERNRDYRTIAHGLRFQQGRTIDDHDTVIWLGDFNYRIGLSDEKVRTLVELGNLQTLYDNDQLNLQMISGLAFPYFSEAKLTFDPTYKYDIGTDRYDTSEKARIPAWCDRVLRRGKNLRQLSYGAAPLRFSDHRPVYATFRCVVSAVDETAKEKLSKEIYTTRRAEVGHLTGSEEEESGDEDHVLDFDPIEPGCAPRKLPPPFTSADLPPLPARSNASNISGPPRPSPTATTSTINSSATPLEASHPHPAKLAKPPPPTVPRKPEVLSRDAQRAVALDMQVFGGEGQAHGLPPLPLKRVSTLPATGRPALPPRGGSPEAEKEKGKGLMDDDEGADIGWVPLRPT